MLVVMASQAEFWYMRWNLYHLYNVDANASQCSVETKTMAVNRKTTVNIAMDSC
jgi:hypothetical protein